VKPSELSPANYTHGTVTRSRKTSIDSSYTQVPTLLKLQFQPKTCYSIPYFTPARTRPFSAPRYPTMPPPRPVSSFLSVTPLEPVLVFESPSAARAFQSSIPVGRIYAMTPSWVYLPLPQGLLRARPARLGDMSWEFEQPHQAANFHREIGYVGTVYSPSREKPHIDRNVYLGLQRK